MGIGAKGVAVAGAVKFKVRRSEAGAGGTGIGAGARGIGAGAGIASETGTEWARVEAGGGKAGTGAETKRGMFCLIIIKVSKKLFSSKKYNLPKDNL